MYMQLDAAGVPHWVNLLEVGAPQAAKSTLCGTLLSFMSQHLMQAVDAVKDVQADAPTPIAPQLDGEQHTLWPCQSVYSGVCQPFHFFFLTFACVHTCAVLSSS